MNTQASSIGHPIHRWWQGRDRPGWRNFGIAMVVLSAALAIALFSAAVAQQGRIILAGTTTVLALGMAAWVGITIVPSLARRTSLRWIAYQVDYRLTREGMIYLGAVFVLVLAAVNTGNNLLFLILACLLGGILISGVLSRIVLTGITLKFDMPEHIFAEQPVVAELELRNEKPMWPSFSLRVIGETASVDTKIDGNEGKKKDRKKEKKLAAEILTRPVFFPYIARATATRQKVELRFPRRGVFRQNAFAIRTRFPFGFFEKTREIEAASEIIVYPSVEPADQFYEVLPLLSGEMASFQRGRGHELHSLREYVPTDSARFVDWKVSAKSARLMVREFAREDERRVLLVFDPFIGPPRADLGALAAAEHAQRFERAVALAASIAWHFHEIHAVMQFRTNSFATSMGPASEIIYDTLRELAVIQPETGHSNAAAGNAFLDELASEREIFKIILTARPQRTISTDLWSSSYFLFIDKL
jgi:uncharacterized protein (DUF58 family)